MSSARRILPNYTYDEYRQWPGEWELIDGIPHAMTPAPSPGHQLITANLIFQFGKAIKEVDHCDCRVYDPLDIMVDQHTVLRPDVLIVCGKIDKLYLDFPPSLVIEVLSPSTRHKDLTVKYDYYQSFGVNYYLVVDPEKDSIICYHLEAGMYMEMDRPGNLLLAEGCSISPDLDTIFL